MPRHRCEVDTDEGILGPGPSCTTLDMRVEAVECTRRGQHSSSGPRLGPGQPWIPGRTPRQPGSGHAACVAGLVSPSTTRPLECRSRAREPPLVGTVVAAGGPPRVPRAKVHPRPKPGSERTRWPMNDGVLP